MKKKIRFYLAPGFLIRFYLLEDIKYILNKHNFSGSLIDVGCGQKPYQGLFEKFTRITSYKGIDFKNFSITKNFEGTKPDFYFDKNYAKTLVLPFQDNQFDNAVAFQVLEHHRDPDKMICEMMRVIRPGGYIMITAPFLGGGT